MSEAGAENEAATGAAAGAAAGAVFGVPDGVRRIFPSRPDATRIVLVRHGEAVCNVSGVVGGARGCTGLTELGREARFDLLQRGALLVRPRLQLVR